MCVCVCVCWRVVNQLVVNPNLQLAHGLLEDPPLDLRRVVGDSLREETEEF